MSTAPKGRFAWYDLVSPDQARSVQFYPAVIGWGTQSWGEAAMPYTMWTAGEVPIGGVGPQTPEDAAAGKRPYWIGHLAVPDLDASLARLLELGGTQDGAVQQVPTVGRIAPVMDPQGGRFELFQPDNPYVDPPRGPVAMGHIAWNELATTDLEGAVAFYTALFGWQQGRRFDTPGGPYQMLVDDGRDMAGVFAPGKMPTVWCYYARVPSAQGTVEAIRANGGTVAMGPMQVPGGDTVVVGVDPHGVLFGAVEFLKA